MNDLLNFLESDSFHGLIPNDWLDNIHFLFGETLSDELITQSVREASDFFNMNAPMDVHEDWTTGVMTGMTFTENDDILVFNRDQMLSMGITDKEGFDLVMTHEGAHRALQGLNTGFDSHQEELCCDYMAGVRAGLNGMDEGKMASSLSGTTEFASHPDGTRRVQAIEAGVTFAHEYMESHNGIPPSFSDCLEHFEKILINAETSIAASEHINLRPEGTISSLSDTQTDGNDTNENSLKAYSQDEIKRKMAKAEKERRYHEGMVEHHTYLAKHNLGPADLQSHLNEVKAHQREVEHWKSEYQKWKWTKPDPIK